MRLVTGIAILSLALGALLLRAPANAEPQPLHAVQISGTVTAINGDLVQFRTDDGGAAVVSEAQLLRAGTPLTLGGHYLLRGTYRDNVFRAQRSDPAAQSVSGIVTNVSGDRITIMQGMFSSLPIDAQRALRRGPRANIAVGRRITVFGYRSGGIFHATRIRR